MPRLRTFISHVAAFSVIATQVLCGCVSASDALMVMPDSPSAMSSSLAHHESPRAERPPCHGEADSLSHGVSGATDEHDCAHCASSLAMAGHGDSPVLLGTNTLELPDLGVAPVSGPASVIPRNHFSDSGPPAVEPLLPAETLVSLKLLLLI